MAEAILITSGKGGAGKSTVASNLAVCFAQMGKKTVLIDLDIGLRSLDIMLGVENRVVYDLADIADGICRVKQALIKRDEKSELYLIAAPQTRDGASLTGEALQKAVDALKARFDIVLLDSPAGIGRIFHNALYASDRCIIVAQPDAVSVRDAERVSRLIEKAGAYLAGVIVNRVKRDTPETYLKALPDAVRAPLLGILPEDEKASQLSSRGITAVEVGSASAKAFRDAARRLLGEDVPFRDVRRSGIRGFFRRAFRKE
ncbi:MAG: septum site-determining protein MinD [Christensenellales bacterium]|jgi:septum site-determining protein MinD